jgi:ATP-binding cassette subfamily A (ABC1) protein 3
LRKVYPINPTSTTVAAVAAAAAGSDPLLKVAVRRLSLGIAEGVCFGLLGPNGAGKSTTMSVLTGDVRATSGKAWVSGHDLDTDLDLVFSQLGYCPQHDCHMEFITAREHLHMFAQLQGVEDADGRSTLVEQVMQHLGLTQHGDTQAQALSGGNRRKLALAVAVIGGPRAIFMDEPSTGVDPVARRSMWRVMTSVKPGRAMILVSRGLLFVLFCRLCS